MTRDEWRIALKLGLAKVRGKDRKPRKLRPCPVRDGLRPSTAIPKPERQRLCVIRALASGICVGCYKPRGEDGTNRYCRPCADKHATRDRARRARWAQNATGR